MSKTITITIPVDLHGRKIEHILSKQLKLSSTLIKQLKYTSCGIMLNGKTAKVIDKVRDGDELCITLQGRNPGNITPSEIAIDILYEDEDIICVNKPPFMPTHPSHGHQSDTLANGIMHYFGDKNFTFHAITRLDRDTSGVVLIAKNQLAAQILTDDIQTGKIQKEYVAIVEGVPSPANGVINAPITRCDISGSRRTVSSSGKDAVTKYEVVETLDNLSFVHLKPITGRTHQLRVHMSYIGTPIYGDEMYGATKTEGRTLLHCHKLTFYHPMTKEEFVIVAPVADDIKIPI